MSDLKAAILDARYIDMIALADFVVQDCGLPDFDGDGTPLPQQNEVAAAIFRWAAMQDQPADTNSRSSRTKPRADKLHNLMSKVSGSGPLDRTVTGDLPNQTAQGDS